MICRLTGEQEPDENEEDEDGRDGACRRNTGGCLAEWQLPPPPESVQLEKTEFEEAQDYIEFSWAGEDARHTGNLVHRLLQLIGEQGVESWNRQGGMSRQLNWCRQQLLREGVQKAKADAIIDRTATAIDNCLSSERGRWILANHEDAHMRIRDHRDACRGK